MSAFGKEIMQRETHGKGGVGGQPKILVLKPEQILSKPQVYADFDLMTVVQTDLDAIAKKHFVSITQVSMSKMRQMALGNLYHQ